MTDDTERALLEFVLMCRDPVTMAAVAKELRHLAKYGASWPMASEEYWVRSLEGLVSTGKLIEENGLVRVPIVGARPKQMEMVFD